jgi:hypothetical protein
LKKLVCYKWVLVLYDSNLEVGHTLVDDIPTELEHTLVEDDPTEPQQTNASQPMNTPQRTNAPQTTKKKLGRPPKKPELSASEMAAARVSDIQILGLSAKRDERLLNWDEEVSCQDPTHYRQTDQVVT